MKNIVLFILALSCSTFLKAQFRNQGSIEFTRSENKKLSVQLEANDDFKNSSYYKEYVKKLPTKSLSFFKLNFDKNGSTYFFVKDEKKPDNNFWTSGKAASENIVIKEFDKHTMRSEKEIYDGSYLLTDSIPTYKWKIFDEVRDIAGYKCRKATTVICDSVVIVAYYTDQILVSSGPESLGGLPGMILGVAIPRLYTTWFATSVSEQQSPETEIKHLKKPKQETTESLTKKLNSSLEDWGAWKNAILWRVRL